MTNPSKACDIRVAFCFEVYIPSNTTFQDVPQKLKETSAAAVSHVLCLFKLYLYSLRLSLKLAVFFIYIIFIIIHIMLLCICGKILFCIKFGIVGVATV